MNGEASSVNKKHSSATIVAEVKRFYYGIKRTKFSVHTGRRYRAHTRIYPESLKVLGAIGFRSWDHRHKVLAPAAAKLLDEAQDTFGWPFWREQTNMDHPGDYRVNVSWQQKSCD